jgi:hypothetical protein
VKHVAGEALRVDADQRGARFHVSHDQGHGFFDAAIPVGTGFAAKSVDTKLSPTRGEIGRGDLANGSHRFIISAEAGGKLNVGLSDICRRSISEREQSAPQNGGENQILPTVPAIDLGRREDCAAIPQKPTPKEQEKSRNQAGSHFGAAFYACKIDCSQGEQPRESQDDPDSRVVPLCPG